MRLEDLKKSIQRVRSAVCGYSYVPERSNTGEPNDEEADITDFLADLRHLCAEEGLDFDTLDKRAAHHFSTERTSCLLSNGLHFSQIDAQLLEKQASILGAIVYDDMHPDEDERLCLAGLWELAHALLDQIEDAQT